MNNDTTNPTGGAPAPMGQPMTPDPAMPATPVTPMEQPAPMGEPAAPVTPMEQPAPTMGGETPAPAAPATGDMGTGMPTPPATDPTQGGAQ
jgi:hypothetical protein